MTNLSWTSQNAQTVAALSAKCAVNMSFSQSRLSGPSLIYFPSNWEKVSVAAFLTSFYQGMSRRDWVINGKGKWCVLLLMAMLTQTSIC